jgi:hypothetical protein
MPLTWDDADWKILLRETERAMVSIHGPSCAPVEPGPPARLNGDER